MIGAGDVCGGTSHPVAGSSLVDGDADVLQERAAALGRDCAGDDTRWRQLGVDRGRHAGADGDRVSAVQVGFVVVVFRQVSAAVVIETQFIAVGDQPTDVIGAGDVCGAAPHGIAGGGLVDGDADVAQRRPAALGRDCAGDDTRWRQLGVHGRRHTTRQRDRIGRVPIRLILMPLGQVPTIVILKAQLVSDRPQSGYAVGASDIGGDSADVAVRTRVIDTDTNIVQGNRAGAGDNAGDDSGRDQRRIDAGAMGARDFHRRHQVGMINSRVIFFGIHTAIVIELHPVRACRHARRGSVDAVGVGISARPIVAIGETLNVDGNPHERIAARLLGHLPDNLETRGQARVNIRRDRIVRNGHRVIIVILIQRYVVVIFADVVIFGIKLDSVAAPQYAYGIDPTDIGRVTCVHIGRTLMCANRHIFQRRAAVIGGDDPGNKTVGRDSLRDQLAGGDWR